MGCGGSKPEEPKIQRRPTTPPKVIEEEEKPNGSYVPFTDFPTPQLLAQAQIDYTQANVLHPSGDDGIPLPFPPPTSRPQIFDPEKCKHIDEYARNTALDLGSRDYKTLVDYLIQPSKNDVEKVRAFFVWIANQGLHRVQAYVDRYGIPPRDTPLFTVYAIIVQRCAGSYVNLLANMCSAAKIPCRIVRNVTVKAVSYRVGDTDIANGNSHCLVYVDGCWRPIDQFWGSQGVITHIDTDWQLIAGRRRTGATKGEYTTVYHCEDYYFLTDPEQFVYAHLPPEADQQLLARPVTAAEYIELAYLNRAFFIIGLSILNQPRCIIKTDTGSLTVQFGLPVAADKRTKTNCELDYSLYKSKYNNEYNVIEGHSIEQYVIVEYVKGRTVCQITVNLPKFGRHKLVVHAKDGVYSSGFLEVCEYLILSSAPHCFDPFPAERKHESYGLTSDAVDLDFAAEVDDSAVIDTSDGTAQLAFNYIRTTTTSLQYVHRLVRYDDSKGGITEIRSFVRHYHQTSTRVVVLLRLPQSGQYVYEIRARRGLASLRQQADLTLLASYLVRSEVGCDDETPFPVSGSDEIGPIGDADGQQCPVVPVSHTKPVFEYSEDKELLISMQADAAGGGGGAAAGVDGISAEMKRCSDGAEHDSTEFTDMETGADGSIKISLRFTQHGAYKLHIRVNLKVVYQYVIFVYKVTVDAFPFPVRQDGWRNDFVLLEPRRRQLTVHETIRFRVEINVHVERVEVVLESGYVVVPLAQAAGGALWEAEVNVEEEGEITLRASFGKQQADKNLLVFTAVSEGAMNELKRRLKQANAEAEKFRQKIDKRRVSERENAKDRRKKKEQKTRKLADSFKKNRAKYEAEDEKIEEEDRNREMEENSEEFSPENANEDVSDGELELQTEIQIDSANNRVPGWQRHFEEIRPTLATEKLRLAAASRDREKLKAAIEEARLIVNVSEAELQQAQHLLDLICAEEDLRRACEDKDAEEIERIIEQIRVDGLEKEMASAVRRAELILKYLGKKRIPADPMQLRDAFAEVRAMHNVQPQVHRFMQAFMLLYGEDEESTKEWKRCQAMFSMQGRECLQRRVTRFTADQVDNEIAARSVQLMDETAITAIDASRMSNGIQTLFHLMKGQIDQMRSKSRSITPADVDRQREIFHRPPLEKEKRPARHANIGSLNI